MVDGNCAGSGSPETAACCFEMLTGHRAFSGETVTDVVASLVAREPDWQAIPANVHPEMEQLIRRCLAKIEKTAGTRSPM